MIVRFAEQNGYKVLTSTFVTIHFIHIDVPHSYTAGVILKCLLKPLSSLKNLLSFFLAGVFC